LIIYFQNFSHYLLNAFENNLFILFSLSTNISLRNFKTNLTSIVEALPNLIMIFFIVLVIIKSNKIPLNYFGNIYNRSYNISLKYLF